MTDKKLPTDYQAFIALSRYARWLPEKGRRENWEETVDRYITFFSKRSPQVEDTTWEELRDSIVSLEVMPSMRCLMTAGVALDRDNVAAFNCSYNAIQALGEQIELTHDKLDEPIKINLADPVDFDEMMYILMCGTGFGYSVERQYITKLPKVGKKLNRRRCMLNNKNYPNVPKEELSTYDKTNNTIHVGDSKYGWSSAFRTLIFELYNGNFEVSWDVSAVRGSGEELKTFGGRASGPEPLVDLFMFTKAMFKKAEGRKLTSIECHDLCCKIADIVVVGGVRRSALISLSNPSDDRLRRAKTGQWWQTEPQRALANNSSCYTEKPEFETFMKEWSALYESRSGERGMFSRVASQKQAAKNGRRDPTWDFGTNPLMIAA
jgi:ribonucleoside-diphosphate reductase alpha chain